MAAYGSNGTPAAGSSSLPDYIRNTPGADDLPARSPGSSDISRPERVTVGGQAPDSPSYRPAHADGSGKPFDVAPSRRRPVVFEEDDDLDVPDFLK